MANDLLTDLRRVMELLENVSPEAGSAAVDFLVEHGQALERMVEDAVMWVRIPVEPTKAYLDAIENANDGTDWVWTGEDEIGVPAPGEPQDIYRALVNAARQQESRDERG